MSTTTLLAKAKKAKARLLLALTEADRWRYPRYFQGRLRPEEANLYLYQSLRNRVPVFAGKLGSVETRVLVDHHFQHRYRPRTLREAEQNAGIFPATPAQLNRAAEELWQALGSLDLLGCWPVQGQARLAMGLARLPKRCEMPDLEPFFYPHPWTYALRGQRVCVIHPFTASIHLQWAKRSQLFDNPAILPPFDLTLVQSPMTTTGAQVDWGDWSEALEATWAEVQNLSFDVALLGCGAYGLPLGRRIRDQGRSAIHLGGSLQLLFGIFGRRWETFDRQRDLINGAWIRPLDADRPKGYQAIEDGCYW
ncbi:MAG: hypothetical protein FJ053_10605 [Cyanobacteria bacterium M_surface_10_m1_298]|nr:hypothetical protein [Cyanobacteria bacterium M_surface_10_m1_298]MBM5793324.1 hypothetical protein [Cyanobacteria bacterium K_DeepCast_0m_m1_088]